MLSPDDRDTLPSRTSVPAVHVMETSFDEDDYPTEVRSVNTPSGYLLV